MQDKNMREQERTEDLEEEKYRERIRAKLIKELEEEKKRMEIEGKVLHNGVWRPRRELVLKVLGKESKSLRIFVELLCLYGIVILFLFLLYRFMLLILRW